VVVAGGEEPKILAQSWWDLLQLQKQQALLLAFLNVTANLCIPSNNVRNDQW
jgi:hypothetical protein